MPVDLTFDASANVSDAISGFSRLVPALGDVGTAADQAGSRGKGFVGGLMDMGGKALGLINPVGLAVSAVTTLGPALLNAGHAASSEQQEIDQLTNTLKNSVPGWDGNTAAIDAAISAGQRKAFSDSDLRASLGLLATDTGDVNEAIRLQGLAMDLAASKGIPLEQATKLISKADDESYAALSKLGIEIEKGTSREDALAAVHAKTAGAADIFANSAEGAGIRLQATLGDAVETVGTAVLPILTGALSSVADFLSGPTFQQGVTFVSGLLTDGLGAAFSFVQGLVGPFVSAVQPLVTAILGIGAGATSTQGPLDGFKGFLATAQQFILTNVIPVIAQLASFLAENLPTAITAVSGFWTGTLQPAIAGVWSFVQTTVFPIVQQLLDWLAVNLPPAITALATFWTGTLQPAIAQAWDFVSTTVFPILGTLLGWLADQIPPTISALATLWTGTFQPALSTIWSFLQENVIPILSSLFNWLSVTIPPVITALADLWTTTLQPALSAVWGFVDKNLMPVLGVLVTGGFTPLATGVNAMAALWKDTLQPALSGVWDFLTKSVIPTISGLGEAVGKAVSLGADLIKGILSGLEKGKDQVIDFIKGIASGAVDAIKDFFGIHSPSAVMADLFGPNGVTGGMARGLERGAGAVVATAQGLQGDVRDALTGGATVPLGGGTAALAGAGAAACGGGDIYLTAIIPLPDGSTYVAKNIRFTSRAIQERADMQSASYAG